MTKKDVDLLLSISTNMKFIVTQGREPNTWLRRLGVPSSFVAMVGAAFYPIYFRPLLLPEEYKNEQSINRAGIVQEDIQPAGLKVWSDPFGRK
ncbi:small integral membrane protein 20 [Geospiza fortis]|uniref:Small integral membrane protein 20 n=1 Tax=Geospiza fortis TaxID=48883 RepID=A0A6I9HBQ0_GEOFO|nr:small integral membrane protein 20 [Geospiza fortis]